MINEYKLHLYIDLYLHKRNKKQTKLPMKDKWKQKVSNYIKDIISNKFFENQKMTFVLKSSHLKIKIGHFRVIHSYRLTKKPTSQWRVYDSIMWIIEHLNPPIKYNFFCNKYLIIRNHAQKQLKR